jgi:hypothetical protein
MGSLSFAFFRSDWRIKVSKLMIDVLAFSNATSLSKCDNFGNNISYSAELNISTYRATVADTIPSYLQQSQHIKFEICSKYLRNVGS